MSGLKDVKKRSTEDLRNLLRVYSTGKATPHSERSRKQIERELDRRRDEARAQQELAPPKPATKKKKAVKKKAAATKKKAAASSSSRKKKAATKKKVVKKKPAAKKKAANKGMTAAMERKIASAVKKQKPDTLKGMIRVVVSVHPEIALRDMSRIANDHGFKSPLGSIRSCLWSVKHEGDPKGDKKPRGRKPKRDPDRARRDSEAIRGTAPLTEAERRVQEADEQAKRAERGELQDDAPLADKLRRRRVRSAKMELEYERRKQQFLESEFREREGSGKKPPCILEKMILGRDNWPMQTRRAVADLVQALDLQYKDLTVFTRVVTVPEKR